MGPLIKRRDFLSLMACASGTLIPVRLLGSGHVHRRSCFLDVTAPFIIDDPGLGISSEIILTSDTFSGVAGHRDLQDQTEYEICLYAADGTGKGEGGVVRRLTVPAMHNTVLPVSELVGGEAFYGGLTVRLRPATRTPMHASDLFSSAFVRWTSKNSFDNIHANPDPLVWQPPKAFFYSMPFPPLDEYACYFSLFNPYGVNSRGELKLHDPNGKVLRRLSYDLKPHSSMLLDLRRGSFRDGHSSIFEDEAAGERKILANGGGTVAVTNENDSVKNFGFLLIRRAGTKRFSIDHPIHQSPYDPMPSKAPVDGEGRFRAKNVLFTPLVFNERKIAGITIHARMHLSSGAPMEENLWAVPLVSDRQGEVKWQFAADKRQAVKMPSSQVEGNAIRLGGQQSCIIDVADMGLPKDFSGGLSLPISPTSNHTLMKAELRVAEWGAFAFTHFRPGVASAHAYQKPVQREGLATDYITSGARLIRSRGSMTRDEIVCVFSIDDQGITGRPSLELFTRDGLVTTVALGEVPPYSCRHYVLSDLLGTKLEASELTLRLVDEKATMIMSVVHVDYALRDIAIDHGSDRFSTFQEFTCKA